MLYYPESPRLVVETRSQVGKEVLLIGILALPPKLRVVAESLPFFIRVTTADSDGFIQPDFYACAYISFAVAARNLESA